MVLAVVVVVVAVVAVVVAVVVVAVVVAACSTTVTSESLIDDSFGLVVVCGVSSKRSEIQQQEAVEPVAGATSWRRGLLGTDSLDSMQIMDRRCDHSQYRTSQHQLPSSVVPDSWSVLYVTRRLS